MCGQALKITSLGDCDWVSSCFISHFMLGNAGCFLKKRGKKHLKTSKVHKSPMFHWENPWKIQWILDDTLGHPNSVRNIQSTEVRSFGYGLQLLGHRFCSGKSAGNQGKIWV